MEKMKLTFVNVGYGEAIYLECPDPAFPEGVFTLLIDGGSGEAAEYADSSSGRIPLVAYLEKRGRAHLDVMVNTHIHEDHLCGLLPVARRWMPSEFWQTFASDFYPPQLSREGLETDSLRKFSQALIDCRQLRQELVEKGCRLRQLSGDGGWFPLCRGLSARILGSEGKRAEFLSTMLLQAGEETSVTRRGVLLSKLDAMMNNFSMILQLEYHGVRILLPGDTNASGYVGLEEDLSSDIFKVGHHGQRDGISQTLFSKIHPRHVVCCASSDRRYNSADTTILQMMEEGGATLHFSDCPVPGVPFHQALCFAIDAKGEIDAHYEGVAEDVDRENPYPQRLFKNALV